MKVKRILLYGYIIANFKKKRGLKDVLESKTMRYEGEICP